MNLDELRTVQSKERRKDSLQQLRDSFYQDVASYIADRKASRDRRAEQVEDPFSDSEVRQLSDELETAEEVAEAVYERRVGKVVKLASFAAAEMPVDDEGMTTEERELFDDLVDRITRNKQAVLDVLSDSAASETADAEPTATPDAEPTTAGPTNPVETAAQQTAADGREPPSQTEPSTPAEKNVLAEAMGADADAPNTETAAESGHADPEPNTAAEPGHAEPESDSTAPATSGTVPADEADTEPDTVLGTSTDGGTADVAEPPRTNRAESEPATTVGADSSQPASTEPADTTDDSDRTTVRITKNVGDIFCVDGREYTLRSEDVVTLPTANAEPLVDRDAAQQLD